MFLVIVSEEIINYKVLIGYIVKLLLNMNMLNNSFWKCKAESLDIASMNFYV